MSYTFGKLISQPNNHDYPFKGNVKMRGFQADFELKRLEKPVEKAPDLEAVDREGFTIGKVWAKKIVRGDSAGKHLFSMTFDGPFMEKAINLTAFPTEVENEFNINWERPKQNAESKADA